MNTTEKTYRINRIIDLDNMTGRDSGLVCDEIYKAARDFKFMTFAQKNNFEEMEISDIAEFLKKRTKHRYVAYVEAKKYTFEAFGGYGFPTTSFYSRVGWVSGNNVEALEQKTKLFAHKIKEDSLKEEINGYERMCIKNRVNTTEMWNGIEELYRRMYDALAA